MARISIDARGDIFVSGRTIFVAALVTFGLVIWWSLRESMPAEDGSVAPSSMIADHETKGAQPTDFTSTARRESTPGIGSPSSAADVSFASYVSNKYRFLTRSPGLDAALLEREKLVVAINTAKQTSDGTEKARLPQLLAEIAEADRKTGLLLAPRDLAGFEVLKSSDIEQFQFEDYVGGISGVAPLSEENRQATLYAKLIHRQRFRQALDDSGLMRGDLTRAQRQFVFNDVSRALRESKDGFLQEARQHLYDDEQFTLLSNYENSEYTAELDKLRRIADAE